MTDGNGNVGVSAASVATVHTQVCCLLCAACCVKYVGCSDPAVRLLTSPAAPVGPWTSFAVLIPHIALHVAARQVTYGSSNHRNSTSLAAHNNSFNGSDAFQAAYGGSHHGGSAPPTPPQHSSAFQVAYGGSNGGTGQLQAPTPQQHSSAFQAAYGGSHRSNSAPPTPPQHSSVFQTAYGNSHHGSSVSLASYDGSYYGSNASLAGYDGSFHGSDAFQAVYGSGASDIDSEDEVLVLQEVTAEEVWFCWNANVCNPVAQLVQRSRRSRRTLIALIAACRLALFSGSQEASCLEDGKRCDDVCCAAEQAPHLT